MKLVRYLMTILMLSTISLQVFAEATEDVINALHDVNYNLGIIMENPKGKSITFWGKTPAEGGIQQLKAKRKRIPLSTDLKEYFDNQLENAVKNYNSRLEDLEAAISQLQTSDFKTIAEKALRDMKGTKEYLMSDYPVLAKYFSKRSNDA